MAKGHVRSMSEGVRPALSAEEWKDGGPVGDPIGLMRHGPERGRLHIYETGMFGHTVENPLGVAAIALSVVGPDGKPLFTREDVRLLRDCVGMDGDAFGRLSYADVQHLADRIESLLPPEE